MKNKVLKGALAAASLLGTFAMATPVLAEDKTSTNGANSTTVNYVVTESYTWAAPANFSFTKNVNAENKSGTVAVTKNVIASKKKVQIKVADDAVFKLADTSNAANTREYTLKKGDASGTALSAGSVVLEVNAGTNTGSQALTFGLKSVGVQKSGNYAGTLKFQSSVVAKS